MMALEKKKGNRRQIKYHGMFTVTMVTNLCFFGKFLVIVGW